MADLYFTVHEVAKLLKLNPLTIYGYINEGKLNAIKISRYYRIEKSELDRFLEAHKLNHKVSAGVKV
jgi:excisionase family DNA binding protein